MNSPSPTKHPKFYEAVQLQKDFDFGRAMTSEVIIEQSAICHGWFSGIQGFDQHSIPTDLMLIVTELGEACEADRKPGPSDHIPDFTGLEEELADVLVRVFHMAGKYNLRLAAAYNAKMAFNFTRPIKHGKGY